MRIAVTIPVEQSGLLAIANTRHGLEAWRPLAPAAHLVAGGAVDRLRTPRDAVAFLSALDVPVPPGLPTTDQLLRLRDVRECARTLAEGDRRGHERRLSRLLRDVQVSVGADGALRPAGDGWDAFASTLALALLDLAPLRRRVKLCHNSACAWLFLDRTKNNTQVWCTTQLCADRLRTRRARRRARG